MAGIRPRITRLEQSRPARRVHVQPCPALVAELLSALTDDTGPHDLKQIFARHEATQ
jgi:Uma2 family endonuclease